MSEVPLRGYQPTPEDLRVQTEALRQFGPEAIRKESLAASFYLSPEDITDDEIREIQEFALNAGADLIRKNPDFTYNTHDIFHLAEKYRRTKGTSAVPDFALSQREEAYTTKKNLLLDELYPLLFLGTSIDGEHFSAPLSVLLQSVEGRAEAARHLTSFVHHQQERILALLEQPPKTNDQERLQDYERLVAILLISSAEANLARENFDRFEGVIAETFASLTDQTRPEHYRVFSQRVFKQEYRSYRRLFLEQFLSDIRSYQTGSDRLPH